MPAIQLLCPSCKTLLALPRPVPAGSSIRCSKCSQVFTVPSGTTEVSAAKPTPAARPAVTKSGPGRSPAMIRQPAANGGPEGTPARTVPVFVKLLLVVGALAILTVGIVLGVLGKVVYDYFTRDKVVAEAPLKPMSSESPTTPKQEKAPAEVVVPERTQKPQPAPAEPSAPQAPRPNTEHPTPAPAPPEVKPTHASDVKADAARIKIPNPKFGIPNMLTANATFDTATKRWTYNMRTINATTGQLYIDVLPTDAPTTLEGYADKLKERDFQDPGREFTQITDKQTLPDGFLIQGTVKDQASSKPEFGCVVVRNVNGAFLRCRNVRVADRPMADKELRQAMQDVMNAVTIRTTPLLSLPPPSGSVVLGDNVTLIVSLAEKGQLVYFDTQTAREIKRVDVDFQPGDLALQGDTLFAVAKGSAQVHALEAATGKETKEYNLGGDAVAHIACHPERGHLYASTTSFGVVSLDPASGAVTTTKGKGHFLAVSPDGKFLYTGLQPPDRDEIEFRFGEDGSMRIFRDRWGKRAMLMKYAVAGPNLKFLSGQNNAAVNGWWMHLTPDGKRLFMVGGGGWRPPAEGGSGGGYITAVFSTDNLQTQLQPIPFSGLNTIFHPVLNLGVANIYGMELTLFNGRSLVKRDTIPLSTEREARPFLLTFAGKGRKLILWNGDNALKEQGLHFLPLPLKPDEEAALVKAMASE